jgi:hypothetical protein
MWKDNVEMGLMRRIGGACVGFFSHRILREDGDDLSTI